MSLKSELHDANLTEKELTALDDLVKQFSDTSELIAFALRMAIIQDVGKHNNWVVSVLNTDAKALYDITPKTARKIIQALLDD